MRYANVVRRWFGIMLFTQNLAPVSYQTCSIGYTVILHHRHRVYQGLLRDKGKRADAKRVRRAVGVGVAVAADIRRVGRRVDGAKPPVGTDVGEVRPQPEDRELALVGTDLVGLAADAPYRAAIDIDLAEQFRPCICPRPAGSVAAAVGGGVQFAEGENVNAAERGDELFLSAATGLDASPDRAADVAGGGVVRLVPLRGVEARPRHDADVVYGERGIADVVADVEADYHPIDAVDRPVVADEKIVEGSGADRGPLRRSNRSSKVLPAIYGVVESSISG